MTTKSDGKTFRIIAPLSNPDEARTLPGLGADEFYFSIQPPGMNSAFSRRELPRANFHSFEDIELAAQIAAKRGVRLFAAVNKTYYTNDELGPAKKILDRCLDAGAAGLIVADAGLLRLLRKGNYGARAEIALSTVAAPTNGDAVEFFSRLGVSRVILPRTVSPKQAARFVRRFPKLRFEALIFNWYCANVDGVCRYQHDISDPAAPPDLVRNGCCFDYEVTCPNGAPAPDSVRRGLTNAQRRSETACGVCSIYDFMQAGVRDFKVVGRLLGYKAKANSVKFLDGCRKIYQESDSREGYIRLSQRYYEQFFGAACSGVCYHRIRMTD
ncbi:MAG: U32 family peptidase [bacterium]